MTLPPLEAKARPYRAARFSSIKPRICARKNRAPARRASAADRERIQASFADYRKSRGVGEGGATAGDCAILSTGLAPDLVVANERRRRNERRQGERRHFPSESIDVTRVEHENLFHVVEQMLQKIRVLERDLRDHRDRLDQIETTLGGRPPRIVKGW